tara:strand:+ start:85003 stop:85458 length:456 start_codon:yes stop_codon:yes gene_type:complete
MTTRHHNAPLLPLKKGNKMRNRGEWRAALYMRKKGHRILAHNYRTGRTEIDLLTLEPIAGPSDGAANGPALHAVEVKSHESIWKHPLETQHRLRRHKTRIAARSFLIEYVAFLRQTGHKQLASELDALDLPVSFDLIWVNRNGLEHFQSIF